MSQKNHKLRPLIITLALIPTLYITGFAIFAKKAFIVKGPDINKRWSIKYDLLEIPIPSNLHSALEIIYSPILNRLNAPRQPSANP